MGKREHQARTPTSRGAGLVGRGEHQARTPTSRGGSRAGREYQARTAPSSRGGSRADRGEEGEDQARTPPPPPGFHVLAGRAFFYFYAGSRRSPVEVKTLDIAYLMRRIAANADRPAHMSCPHACQTPRAQCDLVPLSFEVEYSSARKCMGGAGDLRTCLFLCQGGVCRQQGSGRQRRRREQYEEDALHDRPP